jgi:hypothetical protein
MSLSQLSACGFLAVGVFFFFKVSVHVFPCKSVHHLVGPICFCDALAFALFLLLCQY